MKLQNISQAILCATICIESLNLHSTDRKFYSKTRHTNSEKLAHVHSVVCQKNTVFNNAVLLPICNILDITRKQKNEKSKITSILTSYSESDQWSSGVAALMSQKYIQRFIYKYQKHHKYSLKDYRHITNNKKDKLNIVALTSLYMLYRCLKTKHLFFVYKSFTKSTAKLKVRS